MKDPLDISIKDYTYDLSEEKIAAYPFPERDASKLLVYRNGKITEDIYRHIADHIPENSILVFNNTKVVEARLLFRKTTGGIIEIFCLEPHEQYPDIRSAMMKKEKAWWKCLVGGASKWKPGQVLEKIIKGEKEKIVLQGRYIEKRPDDFIIELSWSPSHLSFAEILHYAGAIPLPPYIKRQAEISDSERYQTVYASEEGSVAAPTAGLHFSNHVFKKLEEKNIQIEYVTLHVGAGTFKPVKSETMRGHIMHSEWYEVAPETAARIRNKNEKKIIAVGTTSLRVLESMDEKGLRGKTDILILPGYKFKMVDGLITNFHQPQSTLLLLVAALVGEEWRKIYDHALKNDFRFLSYGDGCLLLAH